MNLREFLSYLQSLDISIDVHDGRLICDAPKGVLTASLQTEIKQRRVEIIEYLQNKPAPDIESIRSQIRPEVLPLSFAQQRLWFLEQLSPGLATYNIPINFHIKGDLKVDALRQSFNEIIRRHEILRTTFHSLGEQSTQVITPPALIKLPLLDFTNVPPEEREKQVYQYLENEAKRPFNLSEGPLLRATIIQAAPTDHILCIVLHHIISDGWSTGILIQELSDLYTSFINGRSSSLHDLPVQYADFSLWQRQLLSGPFLEQELAYWKEQLAGVPTILEMPADHPRPAVQNFKGASCEIPISSELVESLRIMAQHKGGSPFMVLLAAFQVLLYRYTGQSDFVVASPIANRNHTEIEPLIGFFVNTLPLRARIDDTLPFTAFLANVRETCLEAYAHQDLPFEKIVEELNLPRDLSRNALCQVSFVLQNTPSYSLNLPGLEADELVISTDTSKFDLSLAVNIASQIISIEYSTDLFASGTIERMLDHFQHLLAGILANPEQKLLELPILTDVERHQLLVKWNNTRVEFPKNLCIHQIFETQVEQTPNAVAVRFVNQALTYQELNQKANQLAHYLLSLGIGPDTLVGICAERSLEMVIGLYGILKAGGAYVPFDPTYPADRLAFMLEDAGIRVLLTQEKLLPLLQEQGFAGDIVSLDRDWKRIANENVSNPPSKAGPENLAYMIYTSGSTGKPKGALNTHAGIFNRLAWMQSTYCLDKTDRVLQKTPFSFDVSVWEFFWPLMYGAQLIIARPEGHKDPAYLSAVIQNDAITTLHFVPSMLYAFLDEPSIKACHSLKRVICSGEALPVDLTKRFFQLLNAELHNLYGPTEASVDVSYWACRPNETLSNIPIGHPVANTQLYILDTNLEPVPIGVSGELHIGGIQVGRGYLNRPELTHEKFIPNPFGIGKLYKTGDLARYLPDGNIEYLGRIDNQVKIRGFRIELGEIEAVLTGYSAVQNAVVVARSNSQGQKHLVGYLTMEKNSAAKQEDTIAALRAYLKQKLPDYMVPNALMVLDKLPLSPNGKIDRKALPEPERTALARTSQYAIPQNETERTLAEIWAGLLGIQQVGRHDNFFELGGDSIVSLQFISRAQAKGLYLTPRQVFEAQTIEALAEIAQSNNPMQAEQGLIYGPVPLTPIQYQFFERHSVNPHHFNQSVIISLTRKIDAELLSQTVDYLLEYHDALRLRFEMTTQGWQQNHAKVQRENNLVVQVDLARYPLDEQQSKLESINAEIQTSLNICAGPLIKMAIIDFGPEQPQKLLVIIHHLAIDFVSWEILISDMWIVYDQLSKKLTPKLQMKSSSFKTWAKWLVEDAHRETTLAELPYWLELGQQPILPLPVDGPGPIGQNKDAGQVAVSLSETSTENLLRNIPSVYHTQINDILLTALVQTFAAWTGQSTLLIDLEGHGRETENMDLSHTVGWFTSLSPVCLRLNARENGALIKSIKEQLRRIPRKGLSFGALRYLNQETSHLLARLPKAEICFNYGGQFKTITSESLGGETSELEQLPYLFNIFGAIINNQLLISWTYSRNLYRLETVEKLANNFIENLQNLITHCQSQQSGGYTPSDFPLIAISQANLDRLIGRGTNISDIYPLSPLQSVILSRGIGSPNSGIYFTQTSFQITGNLDIPRFKEAWQTVLNRHSILRTSFSWQDLTEPVQIVHSQVALSWDEQDWRNIPVSERFIHLEKFLQQERQTGFQLDQVPLTKCTLICFDESLYQFIWHCHHLLMDGWSSRIVLREVLDIYEHPENAQKLARPYQDYIAWIINQDLEKLKQFWQEYLAGFNELTILPTQKQIQYIPSSHYAEENLFLTSKLTTDLQMLAQQHRLTLNTICQGAWALVLYHYSHQQDIIFGVTVSGRSAPLADIESRVGLFINTLPLRVKISPNESWLDWLTSIMQEQIKLEQFSYTPPYLIKTCTQVVPTEPLFQSNVRFQNYPSNDIDNRLRGGLKIDHYPGIDYWHYPLNLVIVPNLRLQLSISYDSYYFDASRISQILKNLEIILSRFAVEISGSKLRSILLDGSSAS